MLVAPGGDVDRVERVEIACGREAGDLRRIIGAADLGDIVVSPHSRLDMFFDAAGFLTDPLRLNRTAGAITRDFLTANPTSADLALARPGRMVTLSCPDAGLFDDVPPAYERLWAAAAAYGAGGIGALMTSPRDRPARPDPSRPGRAYGRGHVRQPAS